MGLAWTASETTGTATGVAVAAFDGPGCRASAKGSVEDDGQEGSGIRGAMSAKGSSDIAVAGAAGGPAQAHTLGG